MTALQVTTKQRQISADSGTDYPNCALGKQPKIKYILANPFESVTTTYTYRQKLCFS